jgi:hypothetical protein
MPTLAAHGIGVGLPAGWDGTIGVRDDGRPEPVFGATGAPVGEVRAHPIVHLANFGLPSARGDFGSGAVELMGDRDVFVVLFEHEPAAASTALFRRQGMPRRLRAEDFDPYTCRRGIPGQSAYQGFFTENGRPFCLYVVLGSHARRTRLVPIVNDVLATVSVTAPGAG